MASNPSATYNDTVVRQFAIAAVIWGVVGMTVGVLIASQLAWPELNFGIPWLTYGATNLSNPAVCGDLGIVHVLGLATGYLVGRYFPADGLHPGQRIRRA